LDIPREMVDAVGGGEDHASSWREGQADESVAGNF
jgi:hypothetical protein